VTRTSPGELGEGKDAVLELGEGEDEDGFGGGMIEAGGMGDDEAGGVTGGSMAEQQRVRAEKEEVDTEEEEPSVEGASGKKEANEGVEDGCERGFILKVI